MVSLQCFTCNYRLKHFVFPTQAQHMGTHWPILPQLPFPQPHLLLSLALSLIFPPFMQSWCFERHKNNRVDGFTGVQKLSRKFSGPAIWPGFSLLSQADFCLAMSVLLLLLPEEVLQHLLLPTTVPMELPGARWDLPVPLVLAHLCLCCAAVAVLPLLPAGQGCSELHWRGMPLELSPFFKDLMSSCDTRLRGTHDQREPQHSHEIRC